ncbi:MAG: hypothetical protein JJ992_03530, partial [Planctomycetes bacterium]|nr:hypothetical protein [Planctomycetota bacterium]
LVASSSASPPVLAILPLRDLTRNDRSEFLADGLTDELIAALGGTPGVRVLSRYSVMAFKNSEAAASGAARELGATLVVDGSLQRVDDRLHVSVQLVDVQNEMNIWGAIYDTDVGGFLETQHAIARDIRAEVAQLPKRDSVPAAATNVDPVAVDHYLRGRFHWYKLDPTQLGKALEHFEQAIALAPDFGAAYAGIADVWGAIGYWGGSPATESGKKTRAALDQATAIGLVSPELSMLEGAYRFYIERDWTRARALFDEAVAQNPNLAHAYLLRSLLRATLGDDGALDDIAIARRLDPLNPAIMFARAMCLSGANRYADVETEIDQIREIAPHFRPALELRADLAWIRHEGSARSWERQCWQDDPEICRLLDNSAGGPEALAAMADLLELRSRDGYVSPRVVARLRSLSGQADAALDILDCAAAQGDLMQIDFLTLVPAFEPIRQRPRYRQLASALGLPA